MPHHDTHPSPSPQPLSIEAAATHYARIAAAWELQPHWSEAYEALWTAFRRLLNSFTEQLDGVAFSGPFAQVDYLLRAHKAPTSLWRRVGDARNRMRRAAELPPAELHDYLAADVKAVALLVALLTGEPVPAAISRHFEADHDAPRALLQGQECVRVVVRSVDGDTILCTADGQEGTECLVDLAHEHPLMPGSRQYLRPLLHEGTQLNLIRPQLSGGRLLPELIVVEPDYLVDISAIAACFADYGTTADTYFASKIKPNEATEATTLGNFASQLLDEEMHQTAQLTAYADSARTFFQHNGLTMLSVLPPGSDASRAFHANAQAQRQHIHRAMAITLPALEAAYKPDDLIIEPSFFSEMLGLQGRMDALQRDMSLVLEQKSGKSRFPCPTHPGEKPHAKTPHAIQMLLYMAIIRYNHREAFDRNGRKMQSYLLYSKYDESLVSFPFSPRMVFLAMSLRNQIAAGELRLAAGDVAPIEGLTVEGMNVNQSTGTLWEQYVRPQMDQLLTPLHTATPLEQAYFYRLLTFVAREHLYSKTGNGRKEGGGFASKWHDTLADKLLSGNIYVRLTLQKPVRSDGLRVDELVLTFAADDDYSQSNFRVGDIVVVYPYDGEPDVRRSVVFRGTVKAIATGQIHLALRTPQTDGRFFDTNMGRPWAVEHDFFDSSYGAQYRGLRAFIGAPQARRDLLLMQREPATDTSLRLKRDHGAFNRLALSVKQARDFFLIIGPPGTGKTSYGLMTTLLEELEEEGAAVLMVSYTNRAVDEICGKLAEEGLDYVRLGSTLSAAEAYHDHMMDAIVAQSANTAALQARIAGARIIVGTTTALATQQALFRMKQFTLAIVDEASQILEPHLLPLLAAVDDEGREAISKFVFVGDHKQLPAVVQQSAKESEVADASLRAIGLTNCRLSLFERLLRRYRDRPDLCYMLTRQGRMHPDIARFPNLMFYHGQLDAVPLPHQQQPTPPATHASNGIDELLATRRVAFVAIERPKESPSEKVNLNEAEAIAATAMAIYRRAGSRFNAQETLGIIVPYRSQIAAIRTALAAHGAPALLDVAIDTVERFQGSQRDYILYGFTVMHYHQLRFLSETTFEEQGLTIDRKLNVAMTRARLHLVLFGAPQLLANNTVFRSLIAFVRSRGGFVDVPLAAYLSGRFAPKSTSLYIAEPQHVSYPLPEHLLKGPLLQAKRAAFASSLLPFERLKGQLLESLSLLADNCGGRVRWVDHGESSPATGLVMAKWLTSRGIDADYIALTPTAAAAQERQALMAEATPEGRHLRTHWPRQLADVEPLWPAMSEQPALVVATWVGSLPAASPLTAQQWAREWRDIMAQWPMNHYLFITLDDHLTAHTVAHDVMLTTLFAPLTATGKGQITTRLTADGQPQFALYDFTMWEKG